MSHPVKRLDRSSGLVAVEMSREVADLLASLAYVLNDNLVGSYDYYRELDTVDIDQELWALNTLTARLR